MPENKEDWQNSVVERLVNLNSAQGTTDIELAKMENALSRLDRIIRGDPESDLEGLSEASRRAQTEINKFNRIFEKDYLGHGGLISFINYLVSEQEAKSKTQGYHWAFWTALIPAVVVQFLILIGLLVVSWDNIRGYVVLHQHIRQAASIEATTKKLKIRRSRKPKPPPKPEDPDEKGEGTLP